MYYRKEEKNVFCFYLYFQDNIIVMERNVSIRHVLCILPKRLTYIMLYRIRRKKIEL